LDTSPARSPGTPPTVGVTLLLVLALVAAGCAGGDTQLGEDDRRAVDRIWEAGGDPTKPRPVDFYLYFPSQEQAVEASGDLRSDAYRTRVERAADGDSGWLLLATKRIVLVDDLPRAQQELDDVARRHGGEYDGWDAPTRP
ncbi:MAG: ribonuclease E inhibitor RraB, partial [Actinomycetota bacterium]|nr:ribonuclease E inhibitor RraB [Actinomycetota bacterium]